MAKQVPTETKEKECQGVCPVCDSDDVDFVDSEYNSDTETEYYKCNACRAIYHEIINITRDYCITEYEVEIPLNDRTLFD